MATPAKHSKPHPPIKTLIPLAILLFFIVFFLFLFLYPWQKAPISSPSIRPFNCYDSPQATPVIAATVEGLPHPFLFSLADFGDLPDRPHKNIQRVLKNKPFRRPDISLTIQDLLKAKDKNSGIVVDVGANVGMASFAAAAMGFRVIAFEPVFENLQRICDGVYMNRVAEKVTIYAAAASDHLGTITMHKCHLCNWGKISIQEQ